MNRTYFGKLSFDFYDEKYGRLVNAVLKECGWIEGENGIWFQDATRQAGVPRDTALYLALAAFLVWKNPDNPDIVAFLQAVDKEIQPLKPD